MKNIGKEIVEKYCKHQGYGNYTVNEEKLISAINALVVNKNDLLHDVSNDEVQLRLFAKEMQNICVMDDKLPSDEYVNIWLKSL